MANQEHLEILKQGVDIWNEWRKEHPDIRPDLSGENLSREDLRLADLSETNISDTFFYEANLSGAILYKANLGGADLTGADLSGTRISRAYLRGADLTGANLSAARLNEANLREAILYNTNLSGAILFGSDLSYGDLREAVFSGANLSKANLSETNLSGADLSRTRLDGADLSKATLLRTNFAEAILTNCKIYGISAWNVELKGATQNNLVITTGDEPTITIDNLEVAQFIYLLLNNQKIREVIDTITSKVVLILGRFTPERKAILDALKDELRNRNYLSVLFDFDKPASRDLTETISTLAHMARFVIADLTDAKSIPQELAQIVPNLPSVPVQPLILDSQHEYGMFEHFTRFPWVLPIYHYPNEETLLLSLKESILDPAEQKAKELAQR